MIAEKTWLERTDSNGEKHIVAPFTTLDCIVDENGKKVLDRIAELEERIRVLEGRS